MTDTNHTKILSCFRWKLQVEDFDFYPNGSIVSKHYPNPYILDRQDLSSNTVWTCIPDELLPLLPYGDYIAVFAWILSQVCLCVSSIVYMKCRSHAADCKPVVCHMLSMALVYFFGTMIQFSSNYPLELCAVMSFMAQISFMSQIFWLNILAHDIWKQIYYLRYKLVESVCRHVKNFWSRVLYGWGLPILICTSIIMLNYTNMPLKHSYDKSFCITAVFKYAIEMHCIHAVNAVSMIINCGFLIWTGVNIYHIRNMSHEGGFVSPIQKQLFTICVKLVVISGITWLIDLVGWVAFPHTTKIYIRAIIEIICGFQGVCLFVVYVLNGSAIRRFKQFFPLGSSTM